LKVLDLPTREARDLYQADLALIRPDQVVAWRGNSGEAAPEIFRRVLGKGAAAPTDRITRQGTAT
jgi:hypothetical protein